MLTTKQVEAARASDRRSLRNYFGHLDGHIGPRVHDLCVAPGWDALPIEEQFAAVGGVIVDELTAARGEFLDGRDYYDDRASDLQDHRAPAADSPRSPGRPTTSMSPTIRRRSTGGASSQHSGNLSRSQDDGETVSRRRTADAAVKNPLG